MKLRSELRVLRDLIALGLRLRECGDLVDAADAFKIAGDFAAQADFEDEQAECMWVCSTCGRVSIWASTSRGIHCEGGLSGASHPYTPCRPFPALPRG
jgi:hypothetical protein